LLYFIDVNEEERFGGISKSIKDNNKEWVKWYTCAEPHIE